MSLRQQTGSELITAYGMVMLIISVAIIVVLLLVSAPPAVIPKSCSIYGGLQCQDVVYGANTLGGSVLLIRASFAVPGAINVSSFNAAVGGVKSTNGYCTINGITTGTSSVREGGTILCLAYFSTPSSSAPYSGTFNVSANYCGVTVTSCPQGSSYTFAGSWTAEGGQSITSNYINQAAQTVPGGSTTTTTIHYLYVNVQNGQGSATAANFQQMLSIPQSSYSSYGASDLGNIRFYLGNAVESSSNELYSWCESGCTSGSSTSVFWVLLPSGIAANSNAVLNMTFWPSSTGSYEYDKVYAGEAPQLSSSYAQYDNGGSVFTTSYQNFANTGTPSGWTMSGASINNGVSLPGTGAEYILGPTFAGSIGEGLVSIYGCSSGYSYFGGSQSVGTKYPYQTSTAIGCDSSYSTSYYTAYSEAAGVSNYAVTSTAVTSSNQIYSEYFASVTASTELSYINYAQVASLGTQFSGGNPRLGIYQTGTVTAYLQWTRLRVYPPGGVMPTASFGAVH
ncbi:MAG: hypothetical protein KGH94_04685 [Candidatus Micrarchaeota archaeon]|nr:hypothetical protein [Candidatus Micrarchaeota archaeon]